MLIPGVFLRRRKPEEPVMHGHSLTLTKVQHAHTHTHIHICKHKTTSSSCSSIIDFYGILNASASKQQTGHRIK